MEKKLYELKIDDEFKEIIPGLTESEEAILRSRIREEGCISPITVWDDVIIDGYHRYKICHEEGIPFAVEKKAFLSRDEAIEWIVLNQLGRRNLSLFSKCELALRFEPIIRARARANQGQRNDLSGKAERGIRTRETIGDIVGVSGTQIAKVKYICQKADEETKNRLRNGEISIHSAYVHVKQASGNWVWIQGDKDNCKSASKDQGVAPAEKEEAYETEAPKMKDQTASHARCRGMVLEAEEVEKIKRELSVLASEILLGSLNRDVMIDCISSIGEILD